MKILITGGAGYFGSMLTKYLLNKDHKVTVYDDLSFGDSAVGPLQKNKNYYFINDTILNYKYLERIIYENDLIIHLAAIVGEDNCIRNKLNVENINCKATEFISDICSESQRKLIFLSTCSNYGKNEFIVTEESALNPLGLYAKSKISAEKYIINNCTSSWLVLRMSTLFGVSYKTRTDITINQFVYQHIKKKYLEIYGPETYRPYLHLLDASSIIYNLFNKNTVGVFNIGYDHLNYKKIDIVNIINAILGKCELKYVDIDDPRDYKVSFSKIEKIIDCQNNYTLEYGINELYNHYTES